MLTKVELKQLLSHPNQKVSNQAMTVLKLMSLVELNREQLKQLITKETK